MRKCQKQCTKIYGLLQVLETEKEKMLVRITKKPRMGLIMLIHVLVCSNTTLPKGGSFALCAAAGILLEKAPQAVYALRDGLAGGRAG